MADLRDAIDGGRLAEVAAALRGGAAPGAIVAKVGPPGERR